MAAYTSSQTGFFDVASTWGGAGVPGIGDTWTIQPNHVVTLRDERTTGTSPAEGATTYDGTINGAGGALVIANGGWLKMRGHLLCHAPSGESGGDLEIQAGGRFTFDSSQATDPTDQYKVHVGDVGVVNNSKVVVRGTFANPAIIDSHVDGGRGYFTGSDVHNGGRHDWQGDGVLGSIQANRLGGGPGNFPAVRHWQPSSSPMLMTFHDVLWDESHELYAENIQPDVTWSIDNCSWRRPVSGSKNVNYDIASITTAVTTPPRILTNNSFSKRPRLGQREVRNKNNFFYDGWDLPRDWGSWELCEDNVIRIITPDIARGGDWLDCALILDASTLDLVNKNYSAEADYINPHWCTPLGAGETNNPGGRFVVDHCVLVDLGSDGNGDIDYGANISPFHSTLRYCIVPPSLATFDFGAPHGNVRVGGGTLTTLNGWLGVDCRYEHCTYYGGGQGAMCLAEVGEGHPDMVTLFKSNILWNHEAFLTAGFNYAAYQPLVTPNIVDDAITAGQASHNHHFNIRTDGENGIYNIPTTGTYGANDTNGDPGFVDPTRNLDSWTSSLLGGTHPLTGTPDRYDWCSYGLYLLSLHNDPNHADYNANATIANFLAYIREGFRPTNEALRDSGHDSVTRGAVEMAAGGPPAAPTNLVATAVGSDVQLTWDKTADGGAVEVWRRRL